MLVTWSAAADGVINNIQAGNAMLGAKARTTITNYANTTLMHAANFTHHGQLFTAKLLVSDEEFLVTYQYLGLSAVGQTRILVERVVP